MQLELLEKQIKECRRCESSLGRYGVVPRPIFSGRTDYPIFLLGQAPGRTEYEKNAPFQGDAGKSIKALFAKCGLRNFDNVVYQTSVTKCFPGRRAGSSTDRVPSAAEVANCLPFLAWQLEALGPKLLVCLGGLSWKAFLSMQETDQPGFCSREIGIAKPSEVKVPHMVGRRFHWRSTLVLPMIHPAGSANGARAQYPEQDRNSIELLKASFAEIGVNDL
jgi:uracil-DNA glycosylase family 4